MIKKLFITLIFFAVLCAAAVWYVYSIKFESDEAVRLYIPGNSTEQSIKDTLCSNLGEKYGEWVYRFWTIDKGNPNRSTGSYVIKPETSALNAARTISRSWQTPVRVTLNNMRTIDDLTKQLSSKLAANSEEFLHAIKNDTTYSNTRQYTAAFIPDTYEFYWTASPESVIGKLIDIRNNFWNEERIAKARKLNLTPT